MESDLKKLLEKLNIKPNNNLLFKNAFVHRSILNEQELNIESNERLEFLGDAVLELLITTYLYRFVNKSEGELSAIRAAAVKTSTLALISQKIGLDRFLLLSKGEEQTGGRKKEGILADAFEAFLGAVYLDQGLEKAKEIFEKYLLPYLKDIIKNKKYVDPKTYLQEISQEKFKKLPSYQILKEEGPDHRKLFTMRVSIGEKITGIGQGLSKQQAEEEAARDALHKLETENEEK